MRIRTFTILSMVLLSACSSLNKISLYNLSGLYDNTAFTSFEASVFNRDTNTASLYVSLDMSDMAIGRDEDRQEDYRKVSLLYELFESYESRLIIDSARIVITDSTLLLADTLLSMEIACAENRKYILKLELTDLNGIDAVSRFLVLDHSGVNSANSFKMLDGEGNIMFSNRPGAGEAFSLRVLDSNAGKLFVRHYAREFPLALPPFLEETEANFDYRADSLFHVRLNNGQTELLRLPEEGFYHFQLDTSQRSGLTVFRFRAGFPEVQKTEQMLEPLRYITTIDEFEELNNAEDRKLALDNFWLGNAGNPNRARTMIQKFYGRVEDANTYFTSYHEGWKTDRGLIYIVFGPPRIVYRGHNTEEWLYGVKGNANSLRLQFVKVINPFTENDYSLVKSPAYREKWYNIVNSWRR